MMSLPVLIEPSQLATLLDQPNLIIVDLSSIETYQQGHIPGAIHLPSARLLRGEGDIPNKAPTANQLQALCHSLGLTPDDQVIAYDDQGGPWAGRLMWTLNLLGHDACSVLNGQLPGWLAAGLQLEQGSNAAKTSDPYPISLQTHLVADAAYILAHLNDQQTQIWDARAADEYRGEKVINVKRGGHIPGAINLEWTDCLESLAMPRLKSKTELQQILQQKGLEPHAEIITHCQTHRRSGLTYLVARHLGINSIRCYDGSWFEWGNLSDTPIEV
ncbi:sulfurtransferase [Pontibacter sp. JAM-7]|uniref:sulfurtransferase n=1 Tax=Pontibacter sp. JAM-7 TaxID=3366581 RepID=UPI003AF60CA1